jgi:hypothetical protein
MKANFGLYRFRDVVISTEKTETKCGTIVRTIRDKRGRRVMIRKQKLKRSVARKAQ